VLQLETLKQIAQEYGMDIRLLNVLSHRIPSLHPAQVPYTMQLCRTCKKAQELAAYIEREYGVKSGAVSQKGHFSFELVNCMKNCKAGPSLRWDGVLYPQADERLIRKLVHSDGSAHNLSQHCK